MQTAQESTGISGAAATDPLIGAESAGGTGTTFLGELHDKALAISALIRTEHSRNISYARNFGHAQDWISGMRWSAEEAATTWPWPPDASAD
jgi:hypothetical protein